MTDFPEQILDAIYRLRTRFKGLKNCVVANYPVIEIVRFNKRSRGSFREVSIKLYYQPDGTFILQAPDQEFHSTISHFDFRSRERRIVRHKRYLAYFITDLKVCGLWPLVQNPDIIIVNEFNTRSDKEDVTHQLKKLLGQG